MFSVKKVQITQAWTSLYTQKISATHVIKLGVAPNSYPGNPCCPVRLCTDQISTRAINTNNSGLISNTSCKTVLYYSTVQLAIQIKICPLWGGGDIFLLIYCTVLQYLFYSINGGIIRIKIRRYSVDEI